MTAPTAGLRPRGLTWSVLTTHRLVVRLYLACVVAAGAVLVALHFYGTEVLSAGATCVFRTEPAPPCVAQVAQQEETYRFFMGFVQGGLAFLPLVVAAFVGAALVGREMESGTAALTWTQSVGPVRWLVAKLTFPALFLVLGTVLLTLLVRWARVPDLSSAWFDHNFYLATGPVGTAYALLALVTGAVAGLLLRRTLPALALAVGATGAAMLLGALYRADLWPKVLRAGTSFPETPEHAQILETGLLTPSGERLPFDVCSQTFGPGSGIRACLEKYDAEGYVLFHPASHQLPIQLVETGVVLGLAGVLTVVAFRLLRRRLP